MALGSLTSLILISLSWIGLGITVSEASTSVTINGHNYDVKTILTRDVCVIGGGSSGTYSAIRLSDLGQSVAVVEKQHRLGGHTQTYTDPGTGATIDVGVQVFHDLSIVKKYFARFNISLTRLVPEFSGGVTQYVDFRTGNIVSGYSPSNFTPGLLAYAAQLAKYPYVEDGFDLPYPVPSDLLLPFGDFVRKHSLQSFANFLFHFGQGLGDLLRQPTLYVFKNFGSDIIRNLQTGFLTTALHDNSLLYEAAQAYLGKNVLLNSEIIAMDRGGRRYAKVLIKTPSGLILIKSKKIVFSIPPKLNNLNGFDLSKSERKLFEKFRNTGYYSGLLRNTGIPDGLSVVNTGRNTLYNLAPLPCMYSINPTGIPGLLSVQYVSSPPIPLHQVKEDILSTLKRLKIEGRNTSATPEFAVFNSHSPFELTVPSRAIKAGFYKQLYALQGQRRTYYTGAAFHTQDSSLLWQFTEALLPSITHT